MQSTTTPIPVPLILYSPLLPQYQSYWYPTIHYCPVPVLLIRHSTQMPQYRYATVHFCRSTSLIDKSQSTTAPVPTLSYPTVHLCPSTNLIDTTQYTSTPELVLLILYSILMHQCQSYWYVTVNCWPSISPTHTQQSTTSLAPVLLIHYSTLLPSVSPVGTLQSPVDQFQSYWYLQSFWYHKYNTFQVPFLFIHYSTLLPQYQSYWYVAVHFWPSSSLIDTFQSTSISTSPIDTTEFTSATVPILLKPYMLLLPQYQSYWYNKVNYYEFYWYPTVNHYPSARPSGIMFIIVPVPILLIPNNLPMSQYQSYWYPTVHYCLSTSPTDIL